MMNPVIDESHRNSERDQTDRSLSAERSKTDRTLLESREALEKRTDSAVRSSRATTDHARREVSLRANAVPTRSLSKRNRIYGYLLHERKAADAALESERRRVDSAIQDERRDQKALEKRFLAFEREQMDCDLAQERSATDQEVARAADAFAHEHRAHTATRDALTSREEFLAIVSHDLRSPIGSIAMAAESLSVNPSLADEPQARQDISLISRNAEEALRLIRDLLDMESLAQGKLVLCLESWDLAELLEEAAQTSRRSAEAKGITLEVESPAEPLSARCDKDRIAQVAGNLIANAIKFTPGSGVVSLSVICVDGVPGIEVKDDGPGIPVASRETIFERFSQLHKRERRGLGLGLYISRLIVEAHGGRIWVESEPGKGSRFRFVLPATP